MYSLLDRILSKSNLRTAYDRVVGNRGSSGVDGVTVDDLAGHLRQHWARIEAELRSGTYRPAEVRGVEIPKPNGGTRLLGIPTTTDRFLQQAVASWLRDLSRHDPERTRGFLATYGERMKPAARREAARHLKGGI